MKIYLDGFTVTVSGQTPLATPMVTLPVCVVQGTLQCQACNDLEGSVSRGQCALV